MGRILTAEKAVALLYDRQQGDAPRIVATGQGEIAKRIISLANESGVEIMTDADLVEILSHVPLGDEIPMELYQAVAEILAFVYRVNERYAENHP